MRQVGTGQGLKVSTITSVQDDKELRTFPLDFGVQVNLQQASFNLMLSCILGFGSINYISINIRILHQLKN